MLHLNFTHFPELNTKRLKLRILQQEDAAAIANLRSNKEVNRYLERPDSIEISGARDFIENINKGIGENKWMYWAISLKAQNDLIGTICYWNIVPEKDCAETGYELLPEFQGKGIMQEAFKKVLEFGLRSLKLKTIIAITHPANTRSVKLLEKNYFLPDKDYVHVSEQDAGCETPYYLYLPF